MNKVINEKGNAWWEATTEEVVKVQLFFDSLRQYFVEIEKIEEYVMKKQHDILHFDWPDDTLFDKWMAELVHAKQLEYVETDDEDMDQDEVQIIETLVKEEEKKEKQPIIVTKIGPQSDDLATRQPMVTINLSV